MYHYQCVKLLNGNIFLFFVSFQLFAVEFTTGLDCVLNGKNCQCSVSSIGRHCVSIVPSYTTSVHG